MPWPLTVPCHCPDCTRTVVEVLPLCKNGSIINYLLQVTVLCIHCIQYHICALLLNLALRNQNIYLQDAIISLSTTPLSHYIANAIWNQFRFNLESFTGLYNVTYNVDLNTSITILQFLAVAGLRHILILSLSDIVEEIQTFYFSTYLLILGPTSR